MSALVFAGVAAGVGAGVGLVGPAGAAGRPGPVAQAAAATSNGIPEQLIAKAYTETLGRVPDPGGWRAQVGWWSGRTCNAANLRTFIDGFARSAAAGELAADGYSAAQQTLLAYRFVLDRDPDTGGFGGNRDYLAANGLPALVDAMVSSPEFTGTGGVAEQACGAGAGYGFGSAPATTVPATGPAMPAPDMTDQLQQQVDAATGPVVLPQGAVYGLSHPLVVPPGVVVITAGAPGAGEYARMARLVRLAGFSSSGPSTLVRLQGTAQLDNVWVDGQRSVYPSHFDPTGGGGLDVELRGGSTIDGAVQNDRLSNSEGRMAVTAWGGNDGVAGEAPCAPGTTIAGNLVDGYPSRHLTPDASGNPTSFQSTDGIQMWCVSTNVYGNSIIDVTDAAIVLFAPAGGQAQASTVHDNTVVAIGNSSYYGIAADPLAPGNPTCDEGGTPNGAVASKHYDGTLVDGNHLWTGDRAHINVVLSVGTDEALGSCEHPGAPNGVAELNGTGAVFAANDDDGLQTRCLVGIYVGGMLGAHVPNSNHFGHIILEPGGMPVEANMVVATGTGTASAPNYAVNLVTSIAYTADTSLADDHADNGY